MKIEIIAYVERKYLGQMKQIIGRLPLAVSTQLVDEEDCKISVSGDVDTINRLTAGYSLFKKDRLFLEPKHAN